MPLDSDGMLHPSDFTAPTSSTAAPAPAPNDDATTPAPDDVPDVGGLPAIHPSAPHRFANVNLGTTGFASQRASSYPSGNRSAHFDRPSPAGPPHVQFNDDFTDYRSRDSRPPHVDIFADWTRPPNMGGRIASPRPCDKECQAHHLRTSLFDVAGLASSAYHGGQYGNQTLEIHFIHSCSYQSISPATAEDVLLCYRDIIQVHKKVRQGWTNRRTHVSGPSLERILEKGLAVFPKLKTLTAKDAVNFYDKLQELLAGYLLPLMPFNVIRLEFNFEGLFVPGLGTECYADCAAALMEVLPRLLPTLDSKIEVAIAAVRGKSKNGYDLFWRVMELAVPGFDPTVPIKQPRWEQGSDVLGFSQDHELYFRLLDKKHVFINPRTQTNMFLCAITSSEYADVITTVQLHVDVFRHEDDDGFLPTHLCLRGIATMLHLNARARVRDVGHPRIHRIFGNDTFWEWSADDYPSFHIQGSNPWVFWIERDRDTGGRPFDCSAGRDRATGGNRAFGRNDGHDRDPGAHGYNHCRNDRPNNYAGTKPSGPPQGCFARPDQRRRSYLPGVQCEACKCIGHEAANCDMLAVALFVDRYTKADLSEADRSSIEQKWIARWKDKLGHPARTPRQVMRTYCETHNISADNVNLAMDWEC